MSHFLGAGSGFIYNAGFPTLDINEPAPTNHLIITTCFVFSIRERQLSYGNRIRAEAQAPVLVL